MGLQLRKGREAILKSAERTGGGRFVPRMKWENKETKFLQFITPVDEIVDVLMHPLFISGIREDGSKKYDSFISRRDPNIDGPEGYDDLWDRFEEAPKKQNIALAVEMEPVYEKQGQKQVLQGYEVVYRQFERDNETVEVPNVQLVIQSPSNFYNQLVTLADLKDIEGLVLAIARTGAKTDTTYTITDVGPGLSTEQISELMEEVEFDFDAYLEELADEDRQREIMAEIPDDFVVNQFSKRKGAKKDEGATKPASSTGSRRTLRPKAEPEAEAEAPAEEPAEEPVEEPAEKQPKKARERRFAALRAEMGTPPPATEAE